MKALLQRVTSSSVSVGGETVGKIGKGITVLLGVVPEDNTCETYQRMKAACRELGDYAASVGVTFAIETGPEKPETLAAFIRDVGSKGIGVNLDFAAPAGGPAVEIRLSKSN